MDENAAVDPNAGPDPLPAKVAGRGARGKAKKSKKRREAFENTDVEAEEAPDHAQSDDMAGRMEGLAAALQHFFPPEGGEDAAFWKAKFEALSRVRETEAEADAVQARREVAEQVARVEEMMSGFEASEREEVQTLERARTLLVKEAAKALPAAPAVPAREGDTAGQVAHLKKLLLAYQHLTGMVLQVQEPRSTITDRSSGTDAEEESYLCTAMNRGARRATQFCVTMPGGAGQSATFEPFANVDELPEDLRTDFDVSVAQLPILTAKVNCFLFRDGDVENA